MTHLLTYDFETYYDRTYSLTKLTTEEYIRSHVFEVICFSIKLDDRPAQVYTGTKWEVADMLSRFPFDDSVAVAHNAAFDATILNYHFGIKPKFNACTMSMAKAVNGATVSGSLDAQVKHYELGQKGNEVIAALGKRRNQFSLYDLEKYGAYCANDTELTYKLFDKLRVGFPASEMKLIDMTLRMQTEPVLCLDTPKLKAHLDSVVAKKKGMLDTLSKLQGSGFAAGGKDDVMSNPRLAGLLSQLGVAPPMKISKQTGKETFAFAKTDEDFIALLEHENPAVQALVSARLGIKSTIEETRTERLMGIAERGPLPVPLRYYAAHTGRWGGDGKINMQNLGKGSPIRDAIIAPPGFVLVDADSSQIEARVLAWLAGQEDLIAAFERGEDVYKIMASSIYGVDLSLVSALQRFVGKTTILGCGYGLGPDRFKAALKNSTPSLDLPRDECERIIHAYRKKYPYIPDLWDSGKSALGAIIGNRTCEFGQHEALTVMGKQGIRLPNGLFLSYPNLRWEEPTEGARPEYRFDQKKGKANSVTRIYGGKVVENACQALARIIVGEQALAIAKRYKVVLTVHDAVCAMVPKEEEAEGVAYLNQCMRARPSWAPTLPLACEVGSGASYGDC